MQLMNVAYLCIICLFSPTHGNHRLCHLPSDLQRSLALTRCTVIIQSNSWSPVCHYLYAIVPCWAPVQVLRIDPLHFLAGWRKRRLNQYFVGLYLSQLWQDFCVCFSSVLDACVILSLCVWLSVEVQLIDSRVTSCMLSAM